MTKIKITVPFTLHIEQVGWDELLSSIQIQIRLKAIFFDNASELTINSVWFLCSSFKQFTASLLTNQTAVLIDINNTLLIQVTTLTEGHNILINYRKRYAHSQESSNELIVNLDQDSLTDLKEQFRSMLSWE